MRPERLYAYRKEAPVRLSTHKYAYARLRFKRFFVKSECQARFNALQGAKIALSVRVCRVLSRFVAISPHRTENIFPQNGKIRAFLKTTMGAAAWSLEPAVVGFQISDDSIPQSWYIQKQR
jgi:hypothetical protein